ncbi:MAG: HAD-IC family P-type ATPase [Bacteroidia bacterium]|nr:HAD-IC family P-type ATPase [Bacteroidia bacterium]
MALLLGYSVMEVFKVGVGIAVAAIPEGLPIVLTVTLARRRALVRRLSAIETIGSATVVGSDKTGTLTENRMTVQSFWAAEGFWGVADYRASSDSFLRHLALSIGIYANEAEIADESSREGLRGDPTETALLWAACEAGLSPRELREAQKEVK